MVVVVVVVVVVLVLVLALVQVLVVVVVVVIVGGGGRRGGCVLTVVVVAIMVLLPVIARGPHAFFFRFLHPSLGQTFSTDAKDLVYVDIPDALQNLAEPLRKLPEGLRVPSSQETFPAIAENFGCQQIPKLETHLDTTTFGHPFISKPSRYGCWFA